MSLAPASSLGAFLKARLAVNGIQCAARSFGALTAVGRGLLYSLGPSCVLGIGGSAASYQLRCRTGTPPIRYIPAYSAGLRTGLLTDRRRRPRTPRPRNPRCRALAAALSG